MPVVANDATEVVVVVVVDERSRRPAGNGVDAQAQAPEHGLDGFRGARPGVGRQRYAVARFL